MCHDFRQQPVLRGSQTNLAEFGVVVPPHQARELVELCVSAG